MSKERTNQEPEKMKVIYKYPVRAYRAKTQLPLCLKDKVTGVGMDTNGDVCIWVLQYPDEVTAPQTVMIVGTGNPCIEKKDTVLGTFIDKPFVWHVILKGA